jgi:circadian clock protein KaiB
MSAEDRGNAWVLQLYIAGMTPSATRAAANILAICETHLEGKYDLEIIDLFEKPELAEGRQIVAVPTLIRRLPEPLRKIIGDLSNADKVIRGLDIVLPGFTSA